MNEAHVTSLELSKRLKALGVKQESEFYWIAGCIMAWPDTTIGECSAFLASELGELLPLYLKRDANKGISFSVETDGLQIYKSYDNKVWIVSYSYNSESDRSLANCLAKMLIYLIENKLITM